MPLKELMIQDTRVSDLSPLKGMPLTLLLMSGTHISDLSPLVGIPLETVWIPQLPAESLKILRGIKSLGSINYKPAAAFWKEIDARQQIKPGN